MEKKVCQSCGMPFEVKDDYGTEKDGSLSADYCFTCYKDGHFIEDISLNEMIEACANMLTDGIDIADKQSVRKMMAEMLPTLKRWK